MKMKMEMMKNQIVTNVHAIALWPVGVGILESDAFLPFHFILWDHFMDGTVNR